MRTLGKIKLYMNSLLNIIIMFSLCPLISPLPRYQIWEEFGNNLADYQYIIILVQHNSMSCVIVRLVLSTQLLYSIL